MDITVIPKMEKNLLRKVIAFNGLKTKPELIRELYSKSDGIFDSVYIFANGINKYPDIDDRIYHPRDVKTILTAIKKNNNCDCNRNADEEETLFIFDDSIFAADTSLEWQKMIKEATINNKCYKLTVFLSIPSVICIPEDIWKDINYTFYTAEKFIQNSRKIARMYAIVEEDEEERFIAIMEQIARLKNHYLCIRQNNDKTLKEMIKNNNIMHFSY